MGKRTPNAQVDMTVGSPLGLILRFTLPMMIGNIFQQLYNLVDSIVVGRFVGSLELGGIGCTGSIHYLVFSLGYGISSGIGVMLAILYGAKKKEQLSRAVYNGFYAVGAVALLIATVGFFGAPSVLRWMDTPEAVYPFALSYLRITMLGSVATLLYCAISAVMRAFGDSKTPLYIMIACCIVNVVLDLWFVLGFHMGVEGVAWATIIAQGISAVLGYILVCRNIPAARIKPGSLRPDRALLRQCIRLGIPMAIQDMMIAVSCMVLQRVVNGFGEVVVTANMAVSKIEELVQQPYGSLSAAMAAFTGQNIGARRNDRVKEGFRAGMTIMLSFSAVMVLVVQLFGPQILSIFVVDQEIIAIGAKALRITSLFYVFLGTIYVARGTLNGAGDTVYAAMNGVVELICRLCLAKPLTLIPGLGVWGCFLCSGLTWMGTGLLSFGRFLSGKWNKTPAIQEAMKEA